jgi:hypothetical protein
VRFQARGGSRGDEPAFASRLVIRETRFHGQGTIQDLYGALVADPFRNDLIIRDVRRTLEEGRSPIVLTERREHLDLLAGALGDAARHVVVLHGGVSAKLRRAALERLAQVPPEESRLILATGRYIGEGFDDPRLDTLYGGLSQSLHYLDGATRRLTTCRGLVAAHPPQGYRADLQEHALEEVRILPSTGEFVHPGEAERLKALHEAAREKEAQRQESLRAARGSARPAGSAS